MRKNGLFYIEGKMMQLYHYFRSSASYRVRIALALKGLDYDYRAVHLAKNEQLGEAYASASFSRLVPLLREDDQVISQSLAIIEYLADKVGRDRFWPKADDARAMARSMSAEMQLPEDSPDAAVYGLFVFKLAAALRANAALTVPSIGRSIAALC